MSRRLSRSILPHRLPRAGSTRVRRAFRRALCSNADTGPATSTTAQTDIWKCRAAKCEFFDLILVPPVSAAPLAARSRRKSPPPTHATQRPTRASAACRDAGRRSRRDGGPAARTWAAAPRRRRSRLTRPSSASTVIFRFLGETAAVTGISCGYVPLLEQCSLTLSINYFVTHPCPCYTPIDSDPANSATTRPHRRRHPCRILTGATRLQDLHVSQLECPG